MTDVQNEASAGTALVLAPSLEKMAATTRHRFVLERKADWHYTNGDWTLAAGAQLLPAQAAKDAIAELDRALIKASQIEATALTDTLLTFFPNATAKLNEVKRAAYIISLCEIFTEYPVDVGHKAIKHIRDTRGSLSQSDVVKACRAQWDILVGLRWVAGAHLVEARRRATEALRDYGKTPEEIQADRDYVINGLADLGARLQRKYRASAHQARVANAERMKSLSPEEFEREMRAELDAMRAAEPAYLDRIGSAADFVDQAAARRSLGKSGAAS